MLTRLRSPTASRAPDWTSAATFLPQIQYPSEARRRRITGKGICEITFNRKTGLVSNAVMIKSTGSAILDGATTSQLKAIRVRPNSYSKVLVPINWTLRSR